MKEQDRKYTAHERIDMAVDIAERYAGIDGGHHKQWVIDQMIRLLLGSDYDSWIQEYNEDVECTPWDKGIAP